MASNDEDTTTNDVIDISKQCLTHNSINNTSDKTTLLKLSNKSLLLPLPPPPPPPPIHASLSISTTSSPKHPNQRLISRNNNHKLLSTNLNTNNNSLYSDVLVKSEINLDQSPKNLANFYILPVNQTTNKNQQENIKASPATSIKFSTFQNTTSNNLNNSNSNLYSTPNTSTNNESFTNKLPPVPKRVNINTNNNNIINSNPKISFKNTDTSNSTAKYAIMNSTLNNNGNNSNNNTTMFIQSQDSPHLRIGSYDTMNYKMMAKQQNKNSHNSSYATYRSLNNNKKNIQKFEENRQLNLKNEHNI